jgi:hypothetical protein
LTSALGRGKWSALQEELPLPTGEVSVLNPQYGWKWYLRENPMLLLELNPNPPLIQLIA